MKKDNRTKKELLLEISELRERLREAEETLEAIRSGEVDALIVSSPDGEQVYTLKGAEYPYRIIFETINEGVVILHPDATILSCNRKFSELVREPSEKILGSSFRKYITNENNYRFLEILRDGLSESRKVEVALRAVDGASVPVYLSLNPLFDEGRTDISMVVTDLSQQRLLEKLNDSERKYRTLVESAPDIIVTIDTAGNVRFINSAVSKKLGYEEHDVIGRHFSDFIGSESQSRAYASFESVIKGGTVKGEEVVLVTNLGEPVSFELSAIPVYTGDSVAGGIALLRDITERRKAEEEVRNNRALLRSIIDGTSDTVYARDIKGRYLLLNAAAEKATGKRAAQVIGNDDTLLFPPDEALRAMSGDLRVMSSGKVMTYEETVTDPSGRKRTYLSTRGPLRDAGGSITGVFCIARDITDHRRLEEQLMQAQKMEAVGQLAAGVAHDFNNLLGAIVNYVYLYQTRHPDEKPVREFTDQILQLTERATGLTHSLLAFSRKQDSHPVAADLNVIITRVHKLIRRMIGEDIDINLDLREGCTIMADPLQIEQVLMNLATNARDAMPKGGTITISTSRQMIDNDFIRVHGYGEPGEYAVLAFSDTGMGMDDETAKKIFDPFFTTKVVGKGTGLGLSMVYGIIQQHKGYVNVYSELGKGTVFRMYLPFAESVRDEEKETALPELLPGQGEIILFCEDDEALRNVMVKILGDFNYRVLPAKDGPEALALFNGHRREISLVLLDVIMPKMNGKEVAEEIKKQAPDIPVLFMSGYPERAGHRQQILSDDDECLTKPVAPAVLLRKIRELIHR